jgi:putative zinc finger/helix-turn-helix YgiT family protein
MYPPEGEYTTEYRCRNCGEVVLDAEADEQIVQAFRRQAGLLTPEEIRQNRKKLGLTQEELAERLSVAEAALSRWENGWQIQQRSLDKLIRLFFELPETRQFLQPSSSPGDPPILPQQHQV